MVRLLQVILPKAIIILFVSIPQWCDCCLQDQLHLTQQLVSFNPTMVRLLLYGDFEADHAERVSIPQWCDCCFTATLKPTTLNEFQSHNGAIAAAT
jgi:hypothetical protein